MAYDGTLKFDTSMDSSGFQKGADKLGGIVKGLSVFSIIEKGLGMVTASIDKAVSRYDTLGRFPKIMEQMGFSAGETSIAMQKLSDGIQGLPTSLDQIVGSAQRIASMTGDLTGAADITLALNNAFLASGSSSDAAARGLEQYMQIIGRGKPEMEDWKTLQETMPYALQKVAESFGYAGTSANRDFYAALKDGEITVEQMNARFVELSTATGGFAETAKTATGGIGTAFTNMQTSIVRGVAGVVGAIDNGLSKTRFKSIENVISSTGKAIEGILKGVAGVVGFLAQNLDTLLPIVVGVSAAFKAYSIIGTVTTAFKGMQVAVSAASTILAASTLNAGKDAAMRTVLAAAIANETTAEAVSTAAKKAGLVIDAAGNLITAQGTVATAAETATVIASSGALSAKTVIVGVLTGGISIATAAQWLWNAAMAANPIGLVVAGIALLVAAIVGLVMWLGNSNQAYNEGKQYVEDYGAANDALADSLDETTDNFDKNSNAAEANANTSREMLSGLQALASKGLDRTAQETYQLQAKLNALNSVQQGLNLTIDETTGALSMTAEEVEAYISATESAARATALEDHMKALSEQMVSVESQFIDAERQIALWEQQVESGELSTAKYDKLVADLNAEMVRLETTQAGIVQEMAQNEAAYTQVLAQQEQERQALIALQEDEIRAFAAQHHLSYKDIRADMDENNLTFAGWQEENQKVLDKSQAAVAEFADKWGFSLDDVNTAITASGLTIEDYVERQTEALEHSMEVHAEYTATVTNGFSTMEQESAISLSNFTENMRLNEEATANWAANMNTLMDLGINQGVINQLAQMGPEGAAQAQAFVDELVQMNGGVDLALGNTSVAVATKLAEIDETFNTSLATASAAADAQLRAESYYTAGYASIDKIATGIAENPAATDAATQSGTDIAQSITTAVETVDFSATGQTIGSSMVTGLTSAVSGGVGEITSAATSMSTSVQSVFHTMSTQSQNMVTQMMTGINSTIVSRANTVRASVTSMGNGITAALNTVKTQAVNITTQMMASINSAIVSRTSTVKSSMTSCANGVVTALTELKTKSGTLAEQMMTNINSAIVSRTGTVEGSASNVSSGIVDNLEPMVDGAASVAESMMDGIGDAMDRNAYALYDKAREIANNIADIMADALDVHSPSRVMIRLFGNVMMGIYEGMDGMSGMLYREAQSIADGLAERLTISPDVANALAGQLRGITEANPLGGITLVPQAAYGGAGGGTSYVTSLTQHITTPKPLSPSEMTREGQDLLRRSRWQLP